jgi:hypothetical protein
MFSRVAGAGLALIAAALLAVSLVSPAVAPGHLALFAGKPTVSGHLREKQEAYIGLYHAKLCNTGGDGRCRSGDTKRIYQQIGYAALGATGLLVLGTLLLGASAAANGRRRKAFARLVQVSTVLSLGGVAALLVEGPFSEATVPIGTVGVAIHGGGLFVALIASAVGGRRAPSRTDRIVQPGVPVPPTQRVSRLPPLQSMEIDPRTGRGPARSLPALPALSPRGPAAPPLERAGYDRGVPDRSAYDRGAPHDRAGYDRGAPGRDAYDRSAPLDRGAAFDRGPAHRGSGFEEGATPHTFEREAVQAYDTVPALPELDPDARRALDALADLPIIAGEADTPDPFAPRNDRPPLRPLYDAAPDQGGTGGLVLDPPAASVPQPRSSFGPDDLPTPPPFFEQRAWTRLPASFSPRTQPATFPPPNRPARPYDAPVPMPLPPPDRLEPTDDAGSPISSSMFWPSSETPLAEPPPPAEPMAHSARPATDERRSNPPLPGMPPVTPAPARVSPMPGSWSVSDAGPVAPSPGSLPGMMPALPVAPSITPGVGGPALSTSDASAPAAPAPSAEPSADTLAAMASLPTPRPRLARETQSPPPPRPTREAQPPPPPTRPARETQPPPAIVPGPARPPRETQPPPIVAQPARAQRESQPPPIAPVPLPAQGQPPSRATAVRAAVPMPARPARPASATRPPIPAPAPATAPPPGAAVPAPPGARPAPRPGIPPTIPPPFAIPAIPAIPRIPAIPLIIPQRAETEPDQRLEMAGEVDEITAMTSLDGGGEPPTDAGLRPETTDTSPSGEPVSASSLGSLGSLGSLTDVNGKAASEPALGSLATGTGERARLNLPISTAPDSLPPPRDIEQTSGPQPDCPQCEAPMSWVDEHLRFYCQRCKMYF